ncbi:hypothetical protein [Vibrio parahaemolyticus]|uniref:hypothetical protein n=1 Tax=Vibrio parahaemolyticus TaxID=670 RepID=UPI0027E4ADAC|nr:hypothetical protein [Vibrio parahaemolyticus]WMN82017.1 hypothetical protein NI384_09610 [Vibrio parahaemolyticus]
MAFKIHVNEITENPAFKEEDIAEMAFYVKQTLHRYLEVVNRGYLHAESLFNDPEGGSDMDVAPFQPENPEHVEYADCSLHSSLLQMYKFCFVAEDKKSFLEQSYITKGALGGLNDFIADTLPPCLSYQSLAQNGIMEDYYDDNKIHRLLIAFFANLKLIYGSIGNGINGHFPDSFFHCEHVELLGLDNELFSFRELTMLSGYQTERAVRNLASPSTPEHRKLTVVKKEKGRSTFVTREEAIRWLNSLNRK